jgi:flavorubredoxin
MENPAMFDTVRVANDTDALVSWIPVPGLGALPVQSFVIRSAEPVLVDTGLAGLGEDFMSALRSAIDPKELRWIWLTHTDADHVGNLERVLAEATDARIVTTYLGMGKLGMLGLPVDRAYLVNPGQSLDVGDRTLVGVRPPSFDAPETTGLFDTRSKIYYSSDSFGAVIAAPALDAGEIAPEDLGEGLRLWTTVDSPWLHLVSETRLAESLDEVRALEPSCILGSHLPPAYGMTETLLGHLAAARTMPGFAGPDQAALEQMMAGVTEAAIA